jgi:uncharacterized repeat protein (TIGR03803 family)
MGGRAFGGGTVFRVTGSGETTVVHSVPANSAKEGTLPMGGVVEDNKGKLYGVTIAGGASSLGTVDVLTPDGKAKTLHRFTSTDAVVSPCDGMALAADRNLWGVAARAA